MNKTNRALRLVAAWVVLGSILACGGSDEVVAPAEAPQVRSGAFSALETHLGEGTTYGEGPGGAALAAVVRETLAPGDGVAVRIVPGSPRNVTVLVRYRSVGGYEDLRDISTSERNAEIDRIVAGIDDGYGAGGDNLAVAIRGAMFYGAVGVRMAGANLEYHTGAVVNLSVIETILTAVPGADALVPALVLGTQVEGTVVAPPGSPDAYRLELAEDALLVTQLVTAGIEAPPFVVVCRGDQRPLLCNEADTVEPLEEFSNDGLDALAERVEAGGRALDYQAYRLTAGVYTLAVFAECEGAAPCPAARTSYTLLAATPRG